MRRVFIFQPQFQKTDSSAVRIRIAVQIGEQYRIRIAAKNLLIPVFGIRPVKRNHILERIVGDTVNILELFKFTGMRSNVIPQTLNGGQDPDRHDRKNAQNPQSKHEFHESEQPEFSHCETSTIRSRLT